MRGRSCAAALEPDELGTGSRWRLRFCAALERLPAAAAAGESPEPEPEVNVACSTGSPGSRWRSLLLPGDDDNGSEAQPAAKPR